MVPSHKAGARKAWRQIERTSLLVGLLMSGAYAAARLDTEFSSRMALNRFSRLHPSELDKSEKLGQTVDFTMWSPKRILAYRESLVTKTDPPIAVLLVRKIHLKVPVFDGTDDLTLNRGAGRIIGTGKIGENGNVAIAAHRDGFFRGLKDVARGDAIELVTPDKTIHFVIDRTEVVRPDDVRVLSYTEVPSLTLITCFPFYFVGSAPDRFVVHASTKDFDGPNSPPKTLANEIPREGEP